VLNVASVLKDMKKIGKNKPVLFFFREPGNEGTCTSGGEKI
jgi:hypothetical protein